MSALAATCVSVDAGPTVMHDGALFTQMGVALYFIDKLALRAGHEKDEDEADTVGCCTLKVGFRVAPSRMQ